MLSWDMKLWSSGSILIFLQYTKWKQSIHNIEHSIRPYQSPIRCQFHHLWKIFVWYISLLSNIWPFWVWVVVVVAIIYTLRPYPFQSPSNPIFQFEIEYLLFLLNSEWNQIDNCMPHPHPNFQKFLEKILKRAQLSKYSFLHKLKRWYR
jgi:hypothetical protein